MSYQALYRVWRPQNFDELVGQQMIAETLKNAIKYQQLSHAYLFTGPRGTGKTSAAKILAKAVNCTYQEDGNPCNKCDMCHAITTGQLGDVVEIDAASNNGVEEIRDLRDKVRYASNEALYKVYIIDEVHMLTTGAFNALLKTLEEPPANVLFILATTEPHKIPATIISRTQRFDFQRISEQDLVGRMQYILETDGVAFESEALAIIARAANGGMRDSLSLLDQALSYHHQTLTLTAALEVTGSLSQLVYIDYIQALYAGEGERALAVLQDVLSKGKQASRFVEELIIFCRDMLLTLNAQTNYTLLQSSELAPLEDAVPKTFYYRLIQELNGVQQQMRFATQTDLYVEVMTIQLAQPATASADTMTQLTQRIQALEATIQTLTEQMTQLSSAPVSNSATASNEAGSVDLIVQRDKPEQIQKRYEQKLDDIYEVLRGATRADLALFKEGWSACLSELPPQKRVRMKGTTVLAAGPTHVLIAFDSEQYCGNVQQDNDFVAQLIGHLSRYFNRTVSIAFVLQREWTAVRSNYKVLRDKEGAMPSQQLEPSTEVVQIAPSEQDATPISEQEEALLSMVALSEGSIEETAYSEPGEAPPTVEPLFELVQQEDAQPVVVEQAMTLFGEDIVTVHYDK